MAEPAQIPTKASIRRRHTGTSTLHPFRYHLNRHAKANKWICMGLGRAEPRLRASWAWQTSSRPLDHRFLR